MINAQSILHRTDLGDAVLANGSKLLSHGMKLVLAMVDGRTPLSKLMAAMPQVQDMEALIAELRQHAFVVVLDQPQNVRRNGREEQVAMTMPPRGTPQYQATWESTLMLSNTQLMKLRDRSA